VIVDLSDMTFTDCGALTVLLRAREQDRLAGGDLPWPGRPAGS
jgi:anti-anti-sigma regulatory factor